MNYKRMIIVSVLSILLSSALFANEPSFSIDADFPGGNIEIINIEGDTVRLQQDLRDTDGSWFYWSFRVRGAEGKTLNFKFTRWVVGVRGPAVSNDGGLNWCWLGDIGSSGTEFQYRFGKDEEEVYFGQGMNYTERNLRLFLEKYDNHPALSVETLCTTNKGRDVELLRITDKKNLPRFKVFLSSRHHCGEMMASYALEGIIETALSDTEDGRWLRKYADFFIVPFVDKDGVEDGDQGKNRKPHDHNRDYILRIHPSVRAITEQVPLWQDAKPLFFMDMHCPWLRGGDDPSDVKKGTNEYIYFVGSPREIFWEKLQQFSLILEKERKGTLPYKASNNLPFGVAWNTSANKKGTDLQSSWGWAQSLPNVVFGATIEIPFANAEGAVVDANSARALGYDLARAIRVYLESQRNN